MNTKQYEALLNNAGIVETDYAAYFPRFDIKLFPGTEIPVLFINEKKYIPCSLEYATYEEYETVILREKALVITRNHPKHKAAEALAKKIRNHISSLIVVEGMYNIFNNVIEFEFVDMGMMEDGLAIADIVIRSDDSINEIEEKLNAINIPVFFQTKIIELMIDWK